MGSLTPTAIAGRCDVPTQGVVPSLESSNPSVVATVLEGIKAVATTLGSQETSDEYDKVTYIYTLPHSQTYLTNMAFPVAEARRRLSSQTWP